MCLSSAAEDTDPGRIHGCPNRGENRDIENRDRMLDFMD